MMMDGGYPAEGGCGRSCCSGRPGPEPGRSSTSGAGSNIEDRRGGRTGRESGQATGAFGFRR